MTKFRQFLNSEIICNLYKLINIYTCMCTFIIFMDSNSTKINYYETYFIFNSIYDWAD